MPFCGGKNRPETEKVPLRRMGGGRKKVISFFAGTAWLRSCRFLFQQLFHWDKARKAIEIADVLVPFSAGPVRGFHADALTSSRRA